VPDLDLDDPRSVRRDESGRSPAFFGIADAPCVTAHTVERLLELARESAAKSMRLCLHPRPEAELHDMLVLVRRGAYAVPHKHAAKDETYHLVHGTALLVLFDDDGSAVEHAPLDPRARFLCRVGAGRFHTLVPTSDVLVFHESRPGPFDPRGDGIDAPWAPPRKDEEAGARWLEALAARITSGT
jgi:cupin fold WbuC family metalloprotein